MAERHYQVWLFRHGETEWTITGQHTGRTDLPLTENGKRRARALGRRLKGRPFSLVLCSPLSRARETCDLAGYGDVAEICEDLLEWNYGEYEGRRTVDIQVEEPGWSLWTSKIQGGETVEQVGKRAQIVLERAAAADGDVALFSHGHMLRVIAAVWAGLPPVDGKYLALDTAAVSVLGFEHDYHVVTRWNQDSHLFEVK